MPNLQLIPFATALLVTVALAACTEPADRNVDFSVPADPAGTAETSAPIDPRLAPVEITHEERRVSLLAANGCNLERANGVVFGGAPIEVSRGETLTLSGWVADVETSAVPATADLRFTGTADNRAWKIAVQPAKKRDDVVALLGGNTTLANSGYAASVNLAGLPTGSYRMFVVYSANGGLKSCDNGRAITITD